MRTLLLVFLLLSAAPVLAQEGGATDADLDARAQVHFHAGSDYYERGDYENALRELTIAYEMSSRPELLYNLGACHERMANWGEAARFYEAYLSALPDVENRDAIGERIARLRERAVVPATGTGVATDVTTEVTTEGGTEVATRAADAPDGAPTAATAGGGGGPHPVAFVVLGAGALGLATFAVLGGLTLAEDQALASECGTACSPARASSLESLALGADISLGIGAALAVVGVVLLFTTSDGSGTSETAALRVGPGGLRLEGSF